MSQQTVTAGPYVFFTLPMLEQERIRYIEAMKQTGENLQNASVNGQSFGFGPRRDWSIEEWANNLLYAFEQLSPGQYGLPQGNRSAADFRTNYQTLFAGGWNGS